jgi:hypothetical protein
MAEIASKDLITEVTSPINYNVRNPAIKLMTIMQSYAFTAENFAAYSADTW